MQLGTFGRRASGPPKPTYPKLVINHKTAKFRVPTVAGATDTYDAESIDVVILGQIRSRIMWPGAFGSKEHPVCKSDDAIVGVPMDNFPWEDSMFADVPSNRTGISCETCNFKEWNRDFGRARCQETWTIPVRLVRNGMIEGEVFLIAFTSSGITDLRNYFRPMIAEQKHPFNYVTKIRLRSVGGGDGKRWATARFSRVMELADTDLNLEFVTQLRAVKEAMNPPKLADTLKPFQLP